MVIKCVWIPIKESDAKKTYNILKAILTQRTKPFVEFCNQNRYLKFCKNCMKELQEDIFLLISLCERSSMLIIGGQQWIKTFMNIVKPVTNVKKKSFVDPKFAQIGHYITQITSSKMGIRFYWTCLTCK
jgi:hypothetical protein